MGEISFSDIIGNIGVPAAVCFGIMYWFRADLKDLTLAIKELTKILDKRLDVVEKEIIDMKHEISILKERSA